MIEIVGGGLIGLSCAWELGRRGLNAVVLEREPGTQHMASWAGAGMLGALAETFPDELWRERARESALMYEQWVGQIGGNIDFHPPGPGLDGHVDPRDLLRELSRQVPVETREVTELTDLTGDQVVVCAGAWAGQLTFRGESLPQTLPVKGYLIAWEGSPGMLSNIMRKEHTYILQRANGLILAGSTEQRIGFAAGKDPEQIDVLRRRAIALLPQLGELKEIDVWYGFRPGTPDDMPVLRRLDPKVVLAYGHYRNGILLAPWTARWVADEVQRQAEK